MIVPALPGCISEGDSVDEARSILLEINHRIQRFRAMSLPSMSTEQRQYVTKRAGNSISRADSYEAIGEFWDVHDFTDYDDPAMPDVEFKVMNSDTFAIKSHSSQAPVYSGANGR